MLISTHLAEKNKWELKAHLQPTGFLTERFCYGNLHCLSWQSDWMNFNFDGIFILFDMNIVPLHTMPGG